LKREGRSKTSGEKEDNMMIPSRRKLGAAALIIAGIGAFMVPFLLHSPTTQGTSNNNNNGSHTTTPNPTTPTPTTPTSPGTNNNDNNGGGTTTGTCSDENSDANQDASGDLSVSHNAKDSGTSDSSEGAQGHAYGLVKHQLDTTVALVKSMGIHNGAFHAHHDTKTDNDTVKAQHTVSESSNDHDSSCAEKEETSDD
jgi:hypothetical protein